VRNPFFVGPRLYFRPLERADAPALAAYVNEPSVRRTLSIYRPQSVGQEQAFVESLAKNEHQVVVGISRREYPDKLIGVTGVAER
jgi:RimJ/RimL family protein N-acetyltransferase